MSAPRWPLVVFDLDGTLVNTIPLIVASYQHAVQVVLGEHPSAAEAKGWIGQPLAQFFGQRHPEHADQLIAAYIEWNMAHLEDLIEEYPGVRELLPELAEAGVATGVATSKRRESATLTLGAAGLSEHIDLTVTMEDTPVHKPEPEPLLQAVAQLGGEPGRAAYVGDAVVDVKAAKAAGMTAIAVTWGAGELDDLIAAEPDHLVQTVAELRAVLLGQLPPRQAGDPAP